MSSKWCFLLLIVLGSIVLMATDAHAQLLEDRNKLNTVKKRSGFVIVQRNYKTEKPSGKHKVVKAKKARFSKTHANRGGDNRVVPKYSVTQAGQGDKYKPNPRFSRGSASEGHARWFEPRFTKTSAGQGDDFKAKPRFSKAPSGRTVVVKPRFSKPDGKTRVRAPANAKTGFVKVFDRSPDPANPPQAYSALYEGGYNPKMQKKRKVTNSKDMHPSANHISAKHNDSKTVRNTKRKINVLWVRMNGNKTQPKSVKEKVKKSKFDKDEIDIWNN